MRRTPSRSSRPTAWTQLHLQEPPAVPPTPPPAGEWIDALVADLAIELGAAAEATAYQAQVEELWRRSGLPEGDFAKVLVEVRATAKAWRGRVDHARGGAEPGLRMKACLLMLRDRLGLLETADPPLRHRRR